MLRSSSNLLTSAVYAKQPQLLLIEYDQQLHVSGTMKHQEANLSIHHPASRMTLILNLIVRPEMPLAADFATPEGIVIACISRSNLPGIIGTSLCCNTSILHLNLFACWAGCVAVTMGKCRPRLSHYLRGGCAIAGGRGVCDMIGCCWTRRIDVRRVAVARHCVVISPLVRRIEVSKRVYGTIETGIVVAAVGGVAVVGAVGAVIGVLVVVGMGIIIRTVVYRRLINGSRNSNASTITHSHAHSHADACVTHAIAVGTRHDTGGLSTVCLLASIAQDAALAVARCVDILVARFGVGFHRDG